MSFARTGTDGALKRHPMREFIIGQCLFVPMSEIVTGAAYVEALTSLESDQRARAAFQDLVLRIARPGAALFDFGAGPGLDARLYAERGLQPIQTSAKYRELSPHRMLDYLPPPASVLVAEATGAAGARVPPHLGHPSDASPES